MHMKSEHSVIVLDLYLEIGNSIVERCELRLLKRWRHLKEVISNHT